MLLMLMLLASCSGGSGGGGGGNSPPVADSDSYNGVSEGGPLNVSATAGVLNGDTDANGDTLIAILDSGPANGASFNLNPDGSFSYQHDGTENFSDSFTYHAQDSKGANSSIVTVSISIVPVNDAPVAVDDTYTVAFSGGSINPPAATGVLANDTDAESTVPTNASLVTGVSHGSLALNPNGSFSYNHNGSTWDPCGSLRCDSFTYNANDGSLDSTTPATVTIYINQPPVATNACINTPSSYQAGDAFIDALPATDPEGGVLTYTTDSADSLKGAAIPTDATSGNFSYAPTDNINGALGMDKFTYTVTDEYGLQATGTVWVFLGGDNNVPPPALRIMPLGDSITQGVTDGSLLAGEQVGYREKLYNDLVTLANNKYTVDFVGSQANGDLVGLADTNHEGHPGYCDGPVPCTGGGNITDNVQTWLDSEPADIILLHIGTNDFEAGSPEDTGTTLLDTIDTWELANHKLTIFLARIIDDADPFSGSPADLDVQTFNDGVEALVNARTSDRVFMVDQQSGAGITYTIGVEMAEDLHPNQTGYNKMADRWYTDITTAPVGAKFQGLPQCP